MFELKTFGLFVITAIAEIVGRFARSLVRVIVIANVRLRRCQEQRRTI